MFDFIDCSVILFYSFVIFSSKDRHISRHRTLFYVPFSNLGAFSPLFHSLQLCFYLPHPDIYISCCHRETKRSKIIWVSTKCFAHYSFFNTRKPTSWAGLYDNIEYSDIYCFTKQLYRWHSAWGTSAQQTHRILKTPDEEIQHKKELVPKRVLGGPTQNSKSFLQNIPLASVLNQLAIMSTADVWRPASVVVVGDIMSPSLPVPVCVFLSVADVLCYKIKSSALHNRRDFRAYTECFYLIIFGRLALWIDSGTAAHHV